MWPLLWRETFPSLTEYSLTWQIDFMLISEIEQKLPLHIASHALRNMSHPHPYHNRKKKTNPSALWKAKKEKKQLNQLYTYRIFRIFSSFRSRPLPPPTPSGWTRCGRGCPSLGYTVTITTRRWPLLHADPPVCLPALLMITMNKQKQNPTLDGLTHSQAPTSFCTTLSITFPGSRPRRYHAKSSWKSWTPSLPKSPMPSERPSSSRYAHFYIIVVPVL